MPSPKQHAKKERTIRYLVKGEWLDKKPKNFSKVEAVEIHELMTWKQIQEQFPHASITILPE